MRMRNKYSVDKVAQHCNTNKKASYMFSRYRKMTKYRKIVHVKNYQHRNTANFLILMG